MMDDGFQLFDLNFNFFILSQGSGSREQGSKDQVQYLIFTFFIKKNEKFLDFLH